MGSRPDGWWRDRPGAQARLAALADRWQRTVGQPVCLVFDGPADPGVLRRTRAGFEVRYSGSTAANSADTLIVEVATALHHGAEPLTVVTSDQGLRDRLPASLGTMGAGAFRRRLDAAAPPADR